MSKRPVCVTLIKFAKASVIMEPSCVCHSCVIDVCERIVLIALMRRNVALVRACVIRVCIPVSRCECVIHA